MLSFVVYVCKERVLVVSFKRPVHCKDICFVLFKVVLLRCKPVHLRICLNKLI